MNTSHTSKGALILLLLMFVSPVILAKFALELDWFNKASTNKGQLLTPVIDASELLEQQKKTWRLLYVVPEYCDQQCENAIYSIQQIDKALGKESGRANATLILTETSDTLALNKLTHGSNTEVIKSTTQNVSKVFESNLLGGIFLVDTLNNAMMHYSSLSEHDAAVMQSRDILSDLKKMLKLSRIG